MNGASGFIRCTSFPRWTRGKRRSPSITAKRPVSTSLSPYRLTEVPKSSGSPQRRFRDQGRNRRQRVRRERVLFPGDRLRDGRLRQREFLRGAAAGGYVRPTRPALALCEGSVREMVATALVLRGG